MLKRYDNVYVKCDENIDKNIFDLFCKKLMNSFHKIKDWFQTNDEELLLTLVSKENLNLIVSQKSIQYKNIDIPDWLVGFSNFEEVWVVIPTMNTLEEQCKVALHELAHLLSYKLDTTNKRIKLLDEGIAVFLSNQYEGKIYTPWVNAYLKNELPKVSDFCTYDGMEFAQKRRLQIFPLNY